MKERIVPDGHVLIYITNDRGILGILSMNDPQHQEQTF
jgi:hypothetical protein